MRCLIFGLSLILILFPDPSSAWKADTVKIWARNIGEELWRLSEALTKSNQIRIKYNHMNASVKQKDGKQILNSALQSVSTMLTRKINAVKCIHATAERLAREFNTSIDEDYDFEYCSAKYSKFFFEDGGESNESKFPKFVKEDNRHYMNISLEKDSHFYDISVTSDISCVQVPTNIYYKERDALNAILWSEGLNDIFIQNYKSDPSLAWQYFGSSHGILRFYPGMPWNTKVVDTYDCRVKSWYIEAATCSKDVIILFDVSGSMTGFKNYVARRTLESLLDTLSNNDYVNVYSFKNDTSEVVSCFDGLVQATPENLKTLKLALTPTDDGKKHKVPLEGNANLTIAYTKAFLTLKDRREHKCNVSSTQGCNQLVMVITDYVPGNLTEVFEEYNREVVGNQTYIPVRVFTYLIGKEVTNVQEIQWMACLNRGYYVHIHSVEEVQQQVLKYINVIARPMILAGEEPPPTWTHANIDYTRTKEWSVSKDMSKPDEDKLVTSVAIPAFDYKYNEEHNDDAILLGVAGTDVPIDSIAKLAQPHQLGVNGYSFIVSNNGYLLLHPLLITSINGVLQENYNSVDFVEVEQVDDGKGPRELGPEITMLRQSLVEGVEGSMTQVKVLYHYDSMRRIARVKHDYYFNQLEGTPFSMGISLPRGYGDTELLLKDNPLEAKQGKELTGINVTDYFRYSYRVHPDWVYCKYHYLEGHESPYAEQEIWKFLVNISRHEINITKVQYSEEKQSLPFSVKTHCGNAQLGQNEYYCNEDLVKQLVFDAKLSNPYFGIWYATDEEKELAKKYNVSVRFIATSSGLTRWHYVNDEDKNERVDDNGFRQKNYNGSVFGDIYNTTIEETWYKAAVLQHMISKESLVVATPLPFLDKTIKNPPPVRNEDEDITITASYAIFYKDGESETPASVVGFQYSYNSFFERFKSITEAYDRTRSGEEPLRCVDDKYSCYIVDSSGYIVLSMDIKEVGDFFGSFEIGGRVMKSLMSKNIFEHVEVFNYQALCPVSTIKETSGGWSLTTPFSIIRNLLSWVLTEAFILSSDLYNWNQYADAIPIEDDDADYIELINQRNTESPTSESPLPDDETLMANEEEEEPTFSCDRRISLYILNQTYFLDENNLSPVVYENENSTCHPAYWASYITKTNLLLIVIDNDFTPNEDVECPLPPDTEPIPTLDSTTSREPCHKLDLGALTRRRLKGCFTYHDKERNITACGFGNAVRSNIIFITSLLFISMLTNL